MRKPNVINRSTINKLMLEKNKRLGFYLSIQQYQFNNKILKLKINQFFENPKAISTTSVK